MTIQDVHQVEQRDRRYWYEDGIAELASGGFFVLLGIYFVLQGYIAQDLPVAVILQVSLGLVLILGIYVMRRVINSLKIRITYPRTGYVEYRVPAKSTNLRRYRAAITAAVVAGAVVFLYKFVDGVDSVVLATGVMVGLILMVLPARATGMKRFYLLGALSLALGFILSLSGLPQAYALGLFYGALGIAAMISGGWALRQYLKENPVAAEADNGRRSA